MMASAREPRFLADAMLGRLARWLRVLGFDTTYDAVAPDSELVERAAREDRVLLTRDRHLVRELRPVRVVTIARDAPLEQLAEVIATGVLAPPAELFTRCLVCNTPLEDVADDRRDALLPEPARASGGPVRCCPRCGRVYWHGSHVRRMRGALERALPGWLTR